MALRDRAAAGAPYAQQLLYDPQLQDAIRRAAGSTRDAYARARGKRTREAINDKKLWRRIQQAVAAAWEAWSAVAEPPPKPRWRLKLIALSVAGAGVFVAVNAPVREKALEVLGMKEASTADSSQ